MSQEVKDTRPPPPAWLDREFIQTALRAGDNDSNISVLSCTARMANALGDGYGSDMYRVTATLHNSQQRSVIVKCHPKGGAIGDVLMKWQAFETEIEMFSKTLPALYNILEKAVPGQYKPISAKCLHTGTEPVYFLVLEDLKEIGFIAPKKQNRLDFKHCSVAIKALARFHATSLVLYQQHPSQIEYYDQGLYREVLREDISGLISGSVKSLRDEVTKWPGYEKYDDMLKPIQESYFDLLVNVCKRKEGALNCLIHGDPWLTNMMFKYSNDSIEEFRFVDFQTAHYSSPALDLQYFLHTSCTDEVFDTQMDVLIKEYHVEFLETLKILGCTKYQISLDELKNDLDEHIYFAFFAAVTVLPNITSDAKDGYDIEESLKNKELSLGSNKVFSNKAFVETMKKRLNMFESKGMFHKQR